jgi:hypothetical protein
LSGGLPAIGPRPLPSPEELARLVSYVFETMLTLPCDLIRGSSPQTGINGLSWRTALLPIIGSRPLIVALSSDEKGCLSLGAALFACDVHAVDQEMIDDTLRELVNMIAGQVRTMVVGDQSLGLARIDTAFNTDGGNALASGGECIVLSAGSFRLSVQVLEA